MRRVSLLWPSDKIAVSDPVFFKIRYASALPIGGNLLLRTPPIIWTGAETYLEVFR
jgi:hypothetical protein